jgi:hypothetical protein
LLRRLSFAPLLGLALLLPSPAPVAADQTYCNSYQIGNSTYYSCYDDRGNVSGGSAQSYGRSSSFSGYDSNGNVYGGSGYSQNYGPSTSGSYSVFSSDGSSSTGYYTCYSYARGYYTC